MSKHTPGPWEFQKIEPSAEEEGVFVGGDWFVWPVGERSPVAVAVDENVARMIVAVPKLLLAARNIVECYDHYTVDAEHREAIALLRAAIAAAEGE